MRSFSLLFFLGEGKEVLLLFIVTFFLLMRNLGIPVDPIEGLALPVGLPVWNLLSPAGRFLS